MQEVQLMQYDLFIKVDDTLYELISINTNILDSYVSYKEKDGSHKRTDLALVEYVHVSEGDSPKIREQIEYLKKNR